MPSKRGIGKEVLAFSGFLISLLCIGSSNAAPLSEFYVAGVVELAAEMEPRPINVQQNVNTILQFIVDARKEGVDIVVFPELGITGYGVTLDSMLTLVPDPDLKISPCQSTGYSQAMKNISCSAQENKIYVVINLVEKSPCTGSAGCPSRGWRTFNTNVVFDRTGCVISRYRKSHLFGEPDNSVLSTPEQAIFETDFGVRFGTFTCFDILFERPSVQLVRLLGVTDIAYPTAWFNELPFLTALQAQSAWSYAEDVNILAAGLNDPSVGSAGSAIHLGRQGMANFTLAQGMANFTLAQGMANFTLAQGRDSRLLTAIVPKKHPRNANPFALIQDMDAHAETSNLLASALVSGHDPLEERSQSQLLLRREHMGDFTSVPMDEMHRDIPLCHGNLCCHFHVAKHPSNESTQYRAVVYRGVRSFLGFGTGGVQLCGIIACANRSAESCGFRFPTNVTFNTLSITGSFRAVRSTVMPSTVTWQQLAPLSTDLFLFDKHCTATTCHVDFSLTAPISGILTFAVYGRVFSLDGRSASG